MRGYAAGFVAAALVLGLVAVRALDPVPAPAARRAPEAARARPLAAPVRASLFGDSLTHQSRESFSEAALGAGVTLETVSTRPGAALCDDRDAIVRHLMAHRPDVLVLEYSGNSFTPCMTGDGGRLLSIGSPAWRGRYLDDLGRVTAIAATTGTEIVWATAPPVRHRGDPVDYPDRIASAVRDLAARDAGIRVADTGRAVADGDGYRSSLPCRADESMLCRDGRIAVRADDGLHFDCHGIVDPMGGCAGYSAGARRYGQALATALTTLASSSRDSSG